ncbi:MAG: response regulator [Planctomycetota bacterium]
MHDPYEQVITILLVEDDAGDQELTRRALASGGLSVDLRIVGDGEEALEYLHRVGRYFDAIDSPRPDLILLDLNMPRMNGREFLDEIRQSPELEGIPVVVLTTSRQEVDILESYNLGCNSYIQKPIDVDQFIDAVQQLGKYWFDVVSLPVDQES